MCHTPGHGLMAATCDGTRAHHLRRFRDPETRELVLAGAGELHLEVAVSAITAIAGFTPTSSTPVVTYRETVTSAGPVVLAKSSNKLNRLFIQALPVRGDLVAALEDGRVNVEDVGKTARSLAKKCVAGAATYDTNVP